jgi:peptidoglycan/xylan/chitin deacetylase (PgdA/CDA1 family)
VSRYKQIVNLFLRNAAWVVFLALSCAAVDSNKFEVHDGGIVRGAKNERRMALEFTGDSFADGGEIILNELAKHKAKGSFFFTGKFLRNSEFKPLIQRIVKEGHYLGPHSDSHPLYCPWSGEKNTLVTKEFFTEDVAKNVSAIEAFGVPRSEIKFWIPPYEWYNKEIVEWSRGVGLTLINFTPGTRSTADYTENDAKNFVSSQTIFDSIVKKESGDPNGLNGFLLLTHIGSGPKRSDKFYDRFGDLLTVLESKKYKFVRVDELLEGN